MLLGETGVGKEVTARSVHAMSRRKTAPFVAIHCAALPETLLEAELFGYERGAFTGAQGRKKGMFELADGGTLFLDEIGDMSASAQAKVLRALQSGEISRVGSEKTIAVDVRVIAATNKDLELAVTEGRFREDLFFRLNVVPIVSPSLSERASDVPLLAKGFLREFCKENGVKEKPIDAGVLDALAQRPWPGNVRELRNVVERMAILSGDRITLEDMPAEGRLTEGARDSARNKSVAQELPPAQDPEGNRLSLRDYRNQAEKEYILATLEGVSWNISRAASLLGVERTNLHKKIRAYGLKRSEA
jgi:transcriptional regulator with GAF, ATPase, and Fis domain